MLGTACTKKVKRIDLSQVSPKDNPPVHTLFIAFDGISYDLMAELHQKGLFKEFGPPTPLVVPFPSATTIGFTGIFQPLNAGKIPGYEIRFYSYQKDKIVGGSPWDIHLYPVKYKDYFDKFRHSVFEKMMMYTFPGVAGKQDLIRTEKLVLKENKPIMLSYLGGTDGMQHTIGKKRTVRFMKYVDHMVKRIRKKYQKKYNRPVRIVMFSDHGFHFDKMKSVPVSAFKKALAKENLFLKSNLAPSHQNVVAVKFGVLSAAALYCAPQKAKPVAKVVSRIEGVDLVFWVEGQKVYITNEKGEIAYFSYQKNNKAHAYHEVIGDPLGYGQLLRENGLTLGQMLSSDQWFDLSWNHKYPDAGYRLYDGFWGLVENGASVLVSFHPEYQFGSFPARIATRLRILGHKGTHGALLQEPSYGIIMTDDPTIKLGQAHRYNQMFEIFLPKLTKHYRNNPDGQKKQVSIYLLNDHKH